MVFGEIDGVVGDFDGFEASSRWWRKATHRCIGLKARLAHH
jgi:hypothetical protein